MGIWVWFFGKSSGYDHTIVIDISVEHESEKKMAESAIPDLNVMECFTLACYVGQGTLLACCDMLGWCLTQHNGQAIRRI
jgi:hypothetical protein